MQAKQYEETGLNFIVGEYWETYPTWDDAYRRYFRKVFRVDEVKGSFVHVATRLAFCNVRNIPKGEDGFTKTWILSEIFSTMIYRRCLDQETTKEAFESGASLSYVEEKKKGRGFSLSKR
jgi:hypothetical protein